MTLAELRTRVYKRLGRADDITLDNDIVYAFEMVQDDITSTVNLYELMVHDTTSLQPLPYTRAYSLPSDFGKMIQIWNDDDYGTELRRIYPTNYKNYMDDINATGTEPHYYDIIGASTTSKRIELFPMRARHTQGLITAYANAGGGEVTVTCTAHGLSDDDWITISGTTNYNGTFQIGTVTTNTFNITDTWVADDATGTWELESATHGAITAYANYAAVVTGAVRVTSADHGRTTGEWVTISGTTNYDGTYQITQINDDNFYITATWVADDGTGVWEKLTYLPFIYQRRLDYLSNTTDENILTQFYPQVYIEGAVYYLYRDAIYRDQPEKIAFRKQEYDKQMALMLKAERQPDKITMISPKRIIPSTDRMYNVQTSGYNDA